MGFYYLGKNFLSALKSCNYTFKLLIQHTNVIYKLITNFVSLPPLGCLVLQPYQNHAKKKVVKFFFGYIILAHLRGTHAFFCPSFPLLLLKFKLRAVEPQMHTVQEHSDSAHKACNVVFVGETLPSLRRRTYLGNKVLFCGISFLEVLLPLWKSFWAVGFIGTLGHCGMIMQSLLISTSMVLPPDLHAFAVLVFILMCTTSSKLPCQGTNRNMHQAWCRLGSCEGRSWKMDQKSI